MLREFPTTFELAAPYLCIYQSRESLQVYLKNLTLPAEVQLSLLSEFVTEDCVDPYSAADLRYPREESHLNMFVIC